MFGLQEVWSQALGQKLQQSMQFNMSREKEKKLAYLFTQSNPEMLKADG